MNINSNLFISVVLQSYEYSHSEETPSGQLRGTGWDIKPASGKRNSCENALLLGFRPQSEATQPTASIGGSNGRCRGRVELCHLAGEQWLVAGCSNTGAGPHEIDKSKVSHSQN